MDDCHYGGTLDDDFDGDGDGEDDSDLHGEHEGGEPVVASDVETSGRVGEQQLHHFHLIMITLMMLLQLMLMLMLMMIHLPTASSIHQRNATKAVSVIQIIVFENNQFVPTQQEDDIVQTNLELMSTPSSSKDLTTSISPLTIDNTDQNGD